MTRENFMKKWLFYALGLLPIWMLDCYFLSRYPVYGTTPILLPLAVAAVATMEGQLPGGVFGMWVGFLWATTYPTDYALMIFLLTLFGYLAGTGVQYVLKKGFFGFFICSLSILLGVELCLALGHLLKGRANEVEVVTLAGKQIALTLLYSPLVYGIFRRIFALVGGNKLA